MKGGLGNIMKQAQRMQETMQKAQQELALMEVTGQAGGGLDVVNIVSRASEAHLLDKTVNGMMRSPAFLQTDVASGNHREF